MQEHSEKSISIFNGPALPALGHAIAGSTGAAISNISTYPLSLIITRLQIQRQLKNNSSTPHAEEYTSFQDALEKIYTREGGLNGFYVGVISDTSKTIADSFLFFLAYNFLRQSRIRYLRTPSTHLPVIDELSVGCLAGAASKFLTTPIANIVTRKQTSRMLSSRQPEDTAEQGSVRAITRQIHQYKGLRGFWSGYSASLVLTLNPSLTFFFFETLKRLTLSPSRRSNPSPRVTFLLAALSKAMASTLTYPFSLAKARLQAGCAESNKQHADVERSPSNVFASILHIARSEGIGGLYDGLYGEVLRGFFSHGITMIIKDAVHKLIIQLYYSILKLLKRYPTPQDLATTAKNAAAQVAADTKDQAQQAVETASQSIQTLSTKMKDAGSPSG